MVLYTDCMSVFLAAIQQSFVDSCFYVHIMEKPFSSLKKKRGWGGERQRPVSGGAPHEH